MGGGGNTGGGPGNGLDLGDAGGSMLGAGGSEGGRNDFDAGDAADAGDGAGGNDSVVGSGASLARLTAFEFNFVFLRKFCMSAWLTVNAVFVSARS